MRRRQQVEPAARPDGWYWLRLFVPLRGGHWQCEWEVVRVEGGRVQLWGSRCTIPLTAPVLRNALWQGPIEPPPLDVEPDPDQAHLRAGNRRRRNIAGGRSRLPSKCVEGGTPTPAIAGKEGDMAWAVVWTGDGGEVERVAIRETWGQAVKAVVAWAEAEGRICGSAEGEDFMAIRSSWTRKELRELLEENGSCTDEAGGCVRVVEAN